MTRLTPKTTAAKTIAAALALAASAAFALPAAAATDTAGTYGYSKQARIAGHHARLRHDAYHAGYRAGWRDGHLAAAEGEPVVTGRSAAVDGPVVLGGPLDNGGLLGTGVLDGEGVAGTGVLSGRGALGLGILGF